MSNQRKIHIAFPIEIINREIDFRLMLAGVCAKPKYTIWVGSMKALYRLVQNNRGGLYLGQQILQARFPTADQSRYRQLKANAWSYIHLDEEGAVHPGGPQEWGEILRYRLDPGFLNAEDHVCTWGDWQRDFYKAQNPPCAPNIVTTGQPRFDLYKPAYREYFAAEADDLKNQFGEFVLMNTNFSFVNRPRGTDNAFSARYFYEPSDPQNRLNQIRRWTHMTHILSNFVRLATRISVEFPQLNVVLRPHPSEDVSLYHSIFDGVPNVHIVHQGSVGAWLQAARCLIHDGCTTALEAHFCDVPIINYKSEIETKYDKFLPNLFGFQERSEDSAINRLGTILAGSTPAASPPPNDPRALELLENFRSNAFEKLSAVVIEKASALAPQAFSLPVPRASISRSVKRKLGLQKAKPDNGKLPEFYGFENVDIAGKMRIVQKLVGKDLNWQLHSSEVLTIEI